LREQGVSEVGTVRRALRHYQPAAQGPISKRKEPDGSSIPVSIWNCTEDNEDVHADDLRNPKTHVPFEFCAIFPVVQLQSADQLNKKHKTQRKKSLVSAFVSERNSSPRRSSPMSNRILRYAASSGHY
jgi:hypothetical protein